VDARTRAALRLICRVKKKGSKKRSGGTVGLTSQRAHAKKVLIRWAQGRSVGPPLLPII
jgi:hypothetical protein